jgi:DNA-binding LacI/PurR family transcriptional regulator
MDSEFIARNQSESMKEVQERVPKYLKLAHKIRQQVVAGEFQPGDQLPSFAAMRAHYGISQSTLERVHTILEHEGVVVRQPGRGTFVAQNPLRVLNAARPQSAGIIGFLHSEIHQPMQHPYWGYLQRGVQNVAREQGCEVLLLNESEPRIGWEKIDGVIAVGPIYPSTSKRFPPGMPVVSIVFETKGALNVISDDAIGVREAIAHLTDLGHRRIGYVIERQGVSTAKRLAAYRAALRERAIEPMPDWVRLIHHGDGIEDYTNLGRNTMRLHLQDGWHQSGCSALLTQNDETAIGVIEALEEAGIRVPQDVSVIGFDGTPASTFFRPRLTTVEVPLEEIGMAGARLLLRHTGASLKEVKSLKKSVVAQAFATHLRVGDSTASAAL